jgi:uncharacterized lipoprotein YbaY
MVVTATFGMVAAGQMLRKLAEQANALAAPAAVPVHVAESVPAANDAVQGEVALLS